MGRGPVKLKRLKLKINRWKLRENDKLIHSWVKIPDGAEGRKTTDKLQPNARDTRSKVHIVVAAFGTKSATVFSLQLSAYHKCTCTFFYINRVDSTNNYFFL